MGVAFDGTLTPEQVDTYRKDGFLVIPDFASPDEVAGMLRRADEPSKPSTHPPSRDPSSRRRTRSTSDAYFLDSGNHLSFFFEEDALTRAPG